MMTSNRDYFSKQSAAYATHRPHYPESLFAYLASLVLQHDCALDCATGNGQAAIGLARHFKQVIGMDLSEAQLAGAFPRSNIRYITGRAEDLQLSVHSVDLVTVAQAAHWFDLNEFYNGVNRIAKTGGTLAIWCYNLNHISPAVDTIVRRYSHDTVGKYWPEGRHLVDEGYRTLAFPFREIQPPRIEMETRWTLADLFGYLRSWSATQRYIDALGTNPLSIVQDELRSEWGQESEMKSVHWPMCIRVGFVE